MSYWVVVVTRNGSDRLTRTLDSLMSQKQKPIRITVVDDGSTDATGKVLESYKFRHPVIRVITKPDRGYDIRRVPANINSAWAENHGLNADYFLISGDDCIYPKEYADSLLAALDSNSALVVTSGRPDAHSRRLHESSPSGSGRMIRCSFWRDAGGAYPIKAGWETWLLYLAVAKGLKVKLIGNLVYQHERPRGAVHQFVYWGAAMGSLGYHPLYAMGRILANAVRPSISPTRAINLFRGYLQSFLGSNDGFIQQFDKHLRAYVRLTQSQRITRVVARLLTDPLRVL